MLSLDLYLPKIGNIVRGAAFAVETLIASRGKEAAELFCKCGQSNLPFLRSLKSSARQINAPTRLMGLDDPSPGRRKQVRARPGRPRGLHDEASAVPIGGEVPASRAAV